MRAHGKAAVRASGDRIGDGSGASLRHYRTQPTQPDSQRCVHGNMWHWVVQVTGMEKGVQGGQGTDGHHRTQLAQPGSQGE